MPLYLQKDSDDLISHCSCEPSLAGCPGQLDCPWCGCGWLFSCMTCRKAFTFARAVEVKETWEELAVRDLQARRKSDDAPAAEDVALWVEIMTAMFADLELGERYVCLDGAAIPTSAKSVAFEGWHARHDLSGVPHVAALSDKTVIDSILGNASYWRENALPDA